MIEISQKVPPLDVLMGNILTLTHATERDIDLILVEELKCSTYFVSWLTGKIAAITGAPVRIESSDVTHSKRRTYSRHEIDICLALKTADGPPTYILIENKLDTIEQFQQAESYRAEAELLVQSGEARAAYIVLVCPKAYALEQTQFTSKFDAHISYEDVSNYLAERAI